jgi:uncharacterized protein YecE (DUF72 family)
VAREKSPRTLRRYNLYGWPQRGPGADADEYPEVEAWPALQLRVGTSGWAYPHWKGRFYPEKEPATRHLAWYSRRLPTIEVNSTYYRMPPPAVFTKWRDSVPPGFQFTIKSPGSITHDKRLVDVDAELEEFLSSTRLLADKLGLLLFQFPPGFKADVPLLAAFLEKLPSDVRIALELRHKSWYERDVYMLLAQHERAFVVHDYNKKGTPLVETAPFVYLRLHGPSGRYRGQYDWETMFTWAMQTRDWMERGFEVYTYFNNDERAKSTLNIPVYRELCTGRAEPREARERHASSASA